MSCQGAMQDRLAGRVNAPLPEGASFEAAVLKHREKLYGAAMRLSGSPADADDLVQETVLRAWLFWASFQSGTNCRAWLNRILTNTFVNGYRRRRRDQRLLQDVEKEQASEQAFVEGDPPVMHESMSDEVAAALAQLPEEFRRVLWLVDAQGGSYREAAEAMQCPIGTVMSRLHRARRAFREALGEPGAAAFHAHGFAA